MAKLLPSSTCGSSREPGCRFFLGISRDLYQGIDISEGVSLFIGVAGVFFPDAINDKLIFIEPGLKRDNGFPFPVGLFKVTIVIQRPVVKASRHENRFRAGGLIAETRRE